MVMCAAITCWVWEGRRGASTVARQPVFFIFTYLIKVFLFNFLVAITKFISEKCLKLLPQNTQVVGGREKNKQEAA